MSPAPPVTMTVLGRPDGRVKVGIADAISFDILGCRQIKGILEEESINELPSGYIISTSTTCARFR